jgi:spore maturation protein SpmB
MARFLGGTMGGEAGGMPGMALGVMLGPVIDGAMSSGVTTKIATARGLSQLADALRTGDVARAQATLYQIAAVTGRTAQMKAALTPSLSPEALPKAAERQESATP